MVLTISSGIFGVEIFLLLFVLALIFSRVAFPHYFPAFTPTTKLLILSRPKRQRLLCGLVPQHYTITFTANPFPSLPSSPLPLFTLLLVGRSTVAICTRDRTRLRYNSIVVARRRRCGCYCWYCLHGLGGRRFNRFIVVPHFHVTTKEVRSSLSVFFFSSSSSSFFSSHPLVFRGPQEVCRFLTRKP